MFGFETVEVSRALTAMTLLFHAIFATLGVGVPVLVSIAELIGIKRKDPHYTLLARRWTRGYTITVAVGVVTGTAIGLQLSLIWAQLHETRWERDCSAVVYGNFRVFL